MGCRGRYGRGWHRPRRIRGLALLLGGGLTGGLGGCSSLHGGGDALLGESVGGFLLGHSPASSSSIDGRMSARMTPPTIVSVLKRTVR